MPNGRSGQDKDIEMAPPNRSIGPCDAVIQLGQKFVSNLESVDIIHGCPTIATMRTQQRIADVIE
ncbi:hypothetical protein HETIRDRAFT_409795 [Heterobasidion irregulare TC 32-1]|nr:uncharacterized protein HETIRDRAFT_409795 [Heterobasidion irregulare TC 32-1]ETW82328.1 hypothetical protein HETIRDRAFT_409795 [Heterobasidion irregulare TC 32-1]